MKKRKLVKVLGGAATFALVFSMMSTTAFADFTVGLLLKSDGTLGGKDGESYGESYKEKVIYDSDARSWTIKDLDYTTDLETAVEIEGENNTLNITGTNKITSENASGKNSYGIKSDGDLTLQGDGSLTVKSSDGTTDASAYKGFFSYGIYSKGSITIEGADITATGGNGISDYDFYTYGIATSKDIIINDGNVNAIGGDIEVPSTAGYAGNRSYGIYAVENMEINGGNVSGTGGKVGTAKTGARYSNGIYVGKNLSVNDGSVTGIAGETDGEWPYSLRNGIAVGNPNKSEERGEVNVDGNLVIFAGPSEEAAVVTDGTDWSNCYWKSETSDGRYAYVKIAPPKPVPEPVPESEPAVESATIAGLSGTGNSVSVAVSNGSVSVSEISRAMVEKLANMADNGDAIVLDVSKAGKGSQVSRVSLTKDTLKNIAEVLASASNNKESFVVKTNTASVSLDVDALAAVVSQAGSDIIQIVVENKDLAKLNASQQSAVADIAGTKGVEVIQTFEAYIKSGGSGISDLGDGEVTVSKVDFKVASGMDPENYQVYAIAENGELILCETWVENKSIYFRTGLLANYVLVYNPS